MNYQDRHVIRQDSVGFAFTSPGLVLPTPSGVCAEATKTDPVGDWAGFSQVDGQGNQEAAGVRDLLACPHISVAISWHQRFNGTEAIKVVWPHPAQHYADTFWLNESTYALVGVTTTPDPGYGDRGSVQMTWLPPTKANLALLTVSVPPGFTTGS